MTCTCTPDLLPYSPGHPNQHLTSSICHGPCSSHAEHVLCLTSLPCTSVCACLYAAVKFRGTAAQSNFSLSNYVAELEWRDKVRGPRHTALQGGHCRCVLMLKTAPVPLVTEAGWYRAPGPGGPIMLGPGKSQAPALGQRQGP